MNNKDLNNILSNFDISSSNNSLERINTGYINDSFYVNCNGKRKYVLQKLNTNVFKNIEAIKNNIIQSINKLDNIDYHKIKFINTKVGDIFYSSNKQHWRLMEYVNGSYTKDNANNKNDAYEAGKILGLFHVLLQDEDLSQYHDTLENFHNLPHRIKEFESALEISNNDLHIECKKEIDYCKRMFNRLIIFYNSDLPNRICHNDSKLNNILFNSSNRGLCMIDLDTIMKGYFHYDFGDAIRTIVNPASEEEKDFSKISFNFHRLQHYTKYSSSLKNFLFKKKYSKLLLPAVAVGLIANANLGNNAACTLEATSIAGDC